MSWQRKESDGDDDNNSTGDSPGDDSRDGSDEGVTTGNSNIKGVNKGKDVSNSSNEAEKYARCGARGGIGKNTRHDFIKAKGVPDIEQGVRTEVK